MAGIAAILFFIFFGPATNLGKIDDWQFKPGQFSFPHTVEQLLQAAPFSELWYLYLLALGVIILFLIPVVIFFQGLVMRVRHTNDRILKAKGIHKMSLGLPTTLIALTTLVALVALFSGFYPKDIGLALPLFGGILAVAGISIVVLFVRGLYVWIKFRANPELRKRGRNKFLFAIYNAVLIVVVGGGPLVLMLMMTSVNTFSTGMVGSTSPSFSSMSFSAPVFSLSNPLSGGAIPKDTIGLSVGGAKDINNLRENIKNNFLPIPTDVTYEGLFYDYLFDTGAQTPCQKLFCPSYTSAISKDPFSGQDDYLLSVGLNSNIQQKDFTRKKLNLVIVLDISGSMSSPFNQYYYDQFGTKRELSVEETDTEKESAKTKMQVSAESAVALLEHLNPDDSFGMVLYDDVAYLAKPLRKIGDTDLEAIKGHILELRPQNSTNMSAGMKEATNQFNDYLGANSDEFENRVIFLTDAQPNQGDITEAGMLGITKGNADKKIYTTFIGIGVDFNTELINQITKIRGANYYSVHSASEFRKRMDEGFDYMVTPLVFNLKLAVEAPGFKIQEVYGSPEANEATGEIMKVNTLFPSEKTEGETRGGLVLLHLKRISDDNTIKLTASYEDRNGKQDKDSLALEFDERPEFYSTTGIHKGIVLARYANLLKNWLLDERKITEQPKPTPSEPIVPPPQTYYVEGIPISDPEFVLGRWERQSMKLRVSDEYKKLFAEFISYFEKEMALIGDQSMSKELEMLRILATYQNSQ